MSTPFSEFLDRLKDDMKFQATPIVYTDAQYKSLVVRGIRTLYSDLGNDQEYYTQVDETNGEVSRDLTISEKEYIVNASEIAFLKQIQADVSQIIGYTTDALQITNANKPYENLADQIQLISDRNVELFSKISALGS